MKRNFLIKLMTFLGFGGMAAFCISSCDSVMPKKYGCPEDGCLDKPNPSELPQNEMAAHPTDTGASDANNTNPIDPNAQTPPANLDAPADASAAKDTPQPSDADTTPSDATTPAASADEVKDAATTDAQNPQELIKSNTENTPSSQSKPASKPIKPRYQAPKYGGLMPNGKPKK